VFKKLEDAYEYAPFALRLGLAAMFLTVGIMKAMNLQGTAGFMGSLGFPLPMATAILVTVAEILGGAFLLLGFLTRLAAGWLTIVLIVALISAFLIKFDPSKLGNVMQMLVLISSTIAVALLGPGKWSIDEKLYWE
jgi:putative oxidoreductase